VLDVINFCSKVGVWGEKFPCVVQGQSILSILTSVKLCFVCNLQLCIFCTFAEFDVVEIQTAELVPLRKINGRNYELASHNYDLVSHNYNLLIRNFL